MVLLPDYTWLYTLKFTQLHTNDTYWFGVSSVDGSDSIACVSQQDDQHLKITLSDAIRMPKFWKIDKEKS